MIVRVFFDCLLIVYPPWSEYEMCFCSFQEFVCTAECGNSNLNVLVFNRREHRKREEIRMMQRNSYSTKFKFNELKWSEC